MKTLALRARVFIHCFLVFGYPGETRALVVHILHHDLYHISMICLNELEDDFFVQSGLSITWEYYVDF